MVARRSNQTPRTPGAGLEHAPGRVESLVHGRQSRQDTRGGRRERPSGLTRGELRIRRLRQSHVGDEGAVVAPSSTKSAKTFPRAANQKVVNLRMRRARRPRSRVTSDRHPGKTDPQQWSPGFNRPEKIGRAGSRRATISLTRRYCRYEPWTQVRAVYGQDVDGAPLGFERGDDEGPLDLLSRRRPSDSA